jgi:hypothetical protein
VVVKVQGRGWFGYPLGGGRALGPFATEREAVEGLDGLGGNKSQSE